MQTSAARPATSTRSIPLRIRTGVFLSPYVLLFITLLVGYSYTPPRWQDWNQNSRFDLTVAIVDRGTFRIDDYVANTGDYAIVDGHAYSDKAPGLSLLAVPVYGLTRLAQPLGLRAVSERLAESGALSRTLTPGGEDLSSRRVDQMLALYLATIVCVAIPAAVMGVLLAKMVERTCGCRTAAMLSALIIGLASPVFTYAQAFYGHVPAAACLVAALACIVLREDATLSDRRLLAIGLLLGMGVLIEYPAALAGLPIAFWALVLARRRAVIWGTIGAIPPLVALGICNWIAFGTPRPVGYEHSALWQQEHDTGYLSITYPHWDAIWGISFSPFRGLFFFAPVLLLALAGVWFALRDSRQRTLAIVALASFAAMFLFVGSSAMWWGGFAVGPRYLVPAVPMLAMPLGALIARINAAAPLPRLAGLAGTGLLMSVSAALVLATTVARQNYPPDTIRRTLTGYVWPALEDGDIARNVAMAISLDGVVSLVPLLVVLALGVALIGHGLLRQQAATA
ncbi:MAG TPA: glycosyltransferase family 39 protein [Thermomicrobiales bacterium]|nr:glycosyltransferase family 39 protein [Thermomicrobiales bacterium]